MSRAPRIKAVLFDIDGTLVDSNDFHAEAWQRAIARSGIDIPLDRVRAEIGKGADNLLPALLPDDFVQSHRAQIEQFRSALFEREYRPRLRPFPRVRELLARIAEKRIRIVLASSGGKDEVAHHRDLIGCADLVEATVSGDDVAHSKPCPDIFEAALNELGDVGAHEALIVGDSPYDMQAAGKIGLGRIGLLSGGFAPETLREAGADALYDDPADLLGRFDTSLLAA